MELVISTEERKERLLKLASNRREDIHLCLENIHDPHNVSAIFRTCDAVGIPSVSLIYTIEKYPKIGKKSSASAFKWVEKKKHTSISSCFDELKKDGFKIFASCLKDESKNIYEIDFKDKCAIIFGNEHRGLSEEAIANADELFFIPMIGAVQSLNVSVAAAITLYEVFRQKKKYLNKTEFDLTSFQQSLFEKYLTK